MKLDDNIHVSVDEMMVLSKFRRRNKLFANRVANPVSKDSQSKVKILPDPAIMKAEKFWNGDETQPKTYMF